MHACHSAAAAAAAGTLAAPDACSTRAASAVWFRCVWEKERVRVPCLADGWEAPWSLVRLSLGVCGLLLLSVCVVL